MKTSRRRPFLPQLPLALLIAVTIAITIVTWGRYGNLHIDFGRDLYAAWRISEGDVLYRDIAWFNGPLSQYFNGFMFYVFGQYIYTIYASNLLVLIIMVILIYNIMLKLNDVFTAIVAVLFFLQISAFSSIADVNNYNFISPYSHEITHGILLLLLSIFYMIRFSEKQNFLNAFGCGIAVGLSMLTKPEVAFANIVGVGCGWWFILKYQSDFIEKIKLSFVALLGVVLPSAVAFIFFLFHMPVEMVVNSIVTPLRLMVSSEVRNIPLYRNIFGVTALEDNLMTILKSIFLNGFLIAIILSAKFSIIKDKILNAKVVILILISTFIVYLIIPVEQRHAISISLPSSWPLASLVLVILLCFKKDKKSKSYPIILAMALYSFVLLSKIFFRAVFAHYGIFLLIPASLLLISFIFTAITKISIPYRYKIAQKICVTFLLFLVIFPFVWKTYFNLLGRNVLEKTNRGNIYISRHEQGPVFDAINYLRANIRKNETLAVLPQGAGINYILGNINPTRFITILPLENIAFGAENILNAYAQHPPDWIVILQETTGDTTSTAWMSFARRFDEYSRNYTKSFEGRFFSVFKRKISS